MAPLRPLPFPKNPGADGKPRLRQLFQVAVRDQVAWTAVVNVVGPHLDSKMPAWSYGNRLYRSIWVEEDSDGVKRRKIGRYRHSSGYIYLPFKQSWPIFRRHVYLTTRAMSKAIDLPDMDERTAEEIDLQMRLQREHRCPFVCPEYWQDRQPDGGVKELFWCSIDLEKFYPRTNLTVVRKNIVNELTSNWQQTADKLLESMLQFELDVTSWTSDELRLMDIRPGWRYLRGIPTGLYIAGFLANVGLIGVDRKVVELLQNHNIAHLRFVDDHIVLATTFDELVSWVQVYRDLLADGDTGARVNPDKVEPTELAQFLSVEKRKWKSTKRSKARNAAEEACRLDPQFPSPLMTKTLELVSAIARIDFNLLEPGELDGLNDQLEHLLLVDLPEEEMPEKTRLSFAATRLTRVVECRLGSDEVIAALRCKLESINHQVAKFSTGSPENDQLSKDKAETERKLRDGSKQLGRKVKRAFELLRKVLRERPDRTRLWSRALLMLRLTGTLGLQQLLLDIENIHKMGDAGRLAAIYLRANLLAVLGQQILSAALVLKNEEIAAWRQKAAWQFLSDALTLKLPPQDKHPHWFFQTSWRQYCLVVRCAQIMLRDHTQSNDVCPSLKWPEGILAVGEECLAEGGMGHLPVQWVWWVTRVTLLDLTTRVADFVKVISEPLKPSRETVAFWRFFPQDTPLPILRCIALGEFQPFDLKLLAGWWFDALHSKTEIPDFLGSLEVRAPIVKVYRLLARKQRSTIPLHEWCRFLRQLSVRRVTDPRAGEWTALEIVRQIASLVGAEPAFGPSYLTAARRTASGLPWVHPGNFTVPAAWCEDTEPTWDEWRERSGSNQPEGKSRVVYQPQPIRIADSRYSPLNSKNPLFVSVNPVRGLGLLLYGLLRKTFDLPALWNGPGHADVLGMLPRLLLQESTCSSGTLGVLLGCLHPRVTENLFQKSASLVVQAIDDDSLHDPMRFMSAGEVAEGVRKCQSLLEECQLSTLGHKARQLTPIDIRLLTEPEWTLLFNPEKEERNTDE